MDPAARYPSVTEILADLDTSSFRPTMRFQVQRYRPVIPAVAVAGVVLILAAAGWWALRHRRAPAAAAGPTRTTSVLIADFTNKAGDPLFDGSVEPALGLALEGASFVTTYNRGQARKLAGQLQPGSTSMTEALARLVAVREGVQVVASGTVEKSGSGYSVSVRAVDAVTGKQLAEETEKAPGKDAVLAAVGRAAAGVRAALGDTTPASVQRTAAETFSAGSLEAAHEYAIAQELQWAGKWEEAIQSYKKAVQIDPNLGRAYAGLAAVENNRGRRQEAEQDYRMALARTRPDERPRKVPHSRRLLSADAQPRQRHRRVHRPRQGLPGRHGRDRQPRLRLLRQAGHGQRSHLGPPRHRDLPEERAPAKQLRPDRHVRRDFETGHPRAEDGSRR